MMWHICSLLSLLFITCIVHPPVGIVRPQLLSISHTHDPLHEQGLARLDVCALSPLSLSLLLKIALVVVVVGDNKLHLITYLSNTSKDQLRLVFVQSINIFDCGRLATTTESPVDISLV
jgi:hypothetical protein